MLSNPMMPLKEVANQLPSRGPGTSSLTSAGPQARGSLDHCYMYLLMHTRHVLWYRHAGSSGPGSGQLVPRRQHLSNHYVSRSTAQQHNTPFSLISLKEQRCRHDIATAMRCFSTFHSR